MRRVSRQYGKRAGNDTGQRGFSLIEILVVVALLGMISVIMTIAVSKTLKRQRLETAAHEIQSVLAKAYTTTTATGRSAFVLISPPAADGSRTMGVYDDTDNNGVFNSGADTIIETQLITGDLVLATPPVSASYRSWPAATTANTFFIECDARGRAIDPPNSSTNASTTVGVPITLPAAISLTHKEMGTSGSLRPNIAFFPIVGLLWQPTIQKWVNNVRVS